MSQTSATVRAATIGAPQSKGTYPCPLKWGQMCTSTDAKGSI